MHRGQCHAPGDVRQPHWLANHGGPGHASRFVAAPVNARPWRHRRLTCQATSTATDEDRAYMRKALTLARKALGKTHPNPAVGCVLVKDGKVVGEGYHPKAGMPHAEVYALRGAGNAAAGSTAYVTLEPCNHYGRTPPCSRALVDAGVTKVVVGVGDPNPLVAAQGIATLEHAGIQVVMMDGDERLDAYNLNREFMERMAAEAQRASEAQEARSKKAVEAG